MPNLRSPYRAALLLLAVVLCLTAEHLPFRTFTIADGLASDGPILHMMQCSRGFLWLCTPHGISRFDGHAFRNYGTQDGLANSEVNFSLEARDGTLWFATSAGVARYDPAGSAAHRFTTYSVGPSRWSNSVNSIAEDPRGGLWISTDAGLFHATPGPDGLSTRLVLTPDAPPGSEPASIAPVFYLYRDSRNVIWASTHYAGIYRILPNGAIENYRAGGLPSNVDGPFLEDRRGRLWHGTADGLYQLDPEPRPARPIVLRSFRTPPQPMNYLLDMQEAADGHLWLALISGLAEFDGRSIRTYTAANGLNDSVVWSVLVDRSGVIWAGTRTGGVSRLRREGFVSFGESDGLGPGVVHTLFSPAAGELFAVTRPMRLLRLSASRFVDVTPQFPQVRNFGWGLGQLAMRDHLGEWWFATQDGLCRFAAVRSFEELPARAPRRVYTTRDGLPGNHVWSTFEDSRGDIWIGIWFPQHYGIAVWRRATDRIEDLSHTPGVPAEQPAVSVVQDAAGTLWIGLRSALCRFRNGRFQSFGPSDGVPPGDIQLHIDPADRLWGAARHGGVFRLDDRDSDRPRFTRFTTAEGMPTDGATALTSDRAGNIYAATDRGVARIQPESGRITHWTTAEGLTDNSQQTALRDASGNLWFGGVRGVSRLQLDGPSADPAPPPARITSLLVNERALPLSDVGEIAYQSPRLRARQDRVQISFAAVSPDEPVRYQYKLDLPGEEWSASGPEQTVVYPALRSGDYRFLVRAVGQAGVVGASAASLRFVIDPPVWLRWWFLLLAAASCAAAIYLAARYRLAHQLEVERLRTRIATDLHDDIGSNLSRIAILSEVACDRIGDSSAGLPGSLAQIAALSRESAASIGDIVWAINPRRDSFADLTLRMRRFASDLLGSRDIDFSFKAQDLALPLDADVRRQIFLIFKEALHNVVRHSGARRVEIELWIDGRHAVLAIRDDGRGFDPAVPGSGHGLNAMHSRAERLRGHLSVESAPGEGASLHLRIPLARGRARQNYLHK